MRQTFLSQVLHATNSKEKHIPYKNNVVNFRSLVMPGNLPKLELPEL